MIKESKIRRKGFQPRPSRIRRQPMGVPGVQKAVQPYPTEREIWIVAIGVILFAAAIFALAFGISDVTAN